MNQKSFESIDVALLRVGMYIELELGWLAHPFPTSSFKITSPKQIDVIRSLGRSHIRWVPEKSELATESETAVATPDKPAASGPADERARQLAQEQVLRKQRSELLGAQQRELLACERRFSQTVRQYKQVVE